MKSLLENAKKHQDSYRPLPFWSWNNKLSEDRLRNQVKEMKKQGLGGFFMHARVGLKTPYMQKEWFQCVKSCIEEAKKYDIAPWGYDENGYPSGISDGAVCRASEDYRSTWIEFIETDNKELLKNKKVIAYYKPCKNGSFLRMSEAFSEAGLALIVKNEMRAADPMNEQAVDLFIKLTHETYKKELGSRFGTEMPGFFTDEPQLKQYQLPWSHHFERLFIEKYGYDLLDFIPALKFDSYPGKEKIRNDYWNLVSHLYCNVFGKKIYEWCQKNNCKFTGHIMAEDTLIEQMGSNGGSMPFYMHMNIPGMDWLGRRIGSPLAPKQVSSVAAQTGRKQVLSETFALSGWDVSFAELKWMAQWQFANGINLLCPHLQSYSICGIRKRDYPASLFIQEPWWQNYKTFTDYISSLASVLASGKESCDALLIHPLHSAHILYNGSSKCEAVHQLDESFLNTSKFFEQQHVPYHYGDETVIKEIGSVVNGKLQIGQMSYKYVILPDMYNILSSTVKLLEEFSKQGGKIYYIGKLPEYIDGNLSNAIKELPLIRVSEDSLKAYTDVEHSVSVTESEKECASILTYMRTDGNSIVYFIFNSDLYQSHRINCFFRNIDAVSEISLPSFQQKHVDFQHTANGVSASFEPKGGQSIVLINDSERVQQYPISCDRQIIQLPETLDILSADLNALTLDYCEYKQEGGEWQSPMPVIFLQKKLLDAQTDEQISLRFTFETEMEQLPEKLFLVSENIPDFSLEINSVTVPCHTDEYYLDPDFKKINIAEYIKHGKNEIILTGRFFQRKELYDYLYRPKDLSSNFYAVDFEFESVTYDTELENIYLLGDFSVSSHAEYKEGTRRALFTKPPFVLKAPVKTLDNSDITSQGFPFFAGTIKLKALVTVDKKSDTRYILDIEKPIAPFAELSVNAGENISLAWEPCKIDITDDIKDGENEFIFTLCSGLRNLLGPHHYKYGESYYVGVSTFGDVPGWCEDIEGIHDNFWTDDYCFVKFGLR